MPTNPWVSNQGSNLIIRGMAGLLTTTQLNSPNLAAASNVHRRLSNRYSVFSQFVYICSVDSTKLMSLFLHLHLLSIKLHQSLIFIHHQSIIAIIQMAPIPTFRNLTFALRAVDTGNTQIRKPPRKDYTPEERERAGYLVMGFLICAVLVVLLVLG